MTDINKAVIEFINQNKSMKEICNELSISQKQLYVRIRQLLNYGYQISPSYNYNSDIYYKIEKGFVDLKNNEISIKFPKSKDTFKCLVISDIHVGNVGYDVRLLNEVYEYAAKNSINIILICGDMLEGVHSSDKKKIHDMYKQVEELIRQYPYDKNIMNFGILGNHDYHFLHYDGLDVLKWISNSRYDIVLLGYGEGLIKLKDDRILLHHNLSVIRNKDAYPEHKIILSGHGHMMKSKLYDGLNLCVPTISHVYPDKTKDVLPGFIDLTLYIEKSRIANVEAHHMIITDKPYEASQTRCKIKALPRPKNTDEMEK